MLKKLFLSYFILINFLNVFSDPIDYFDYPDYKFNVVIYENKNAFEKSPTSENMLILREFELQPVYDESEKTLKPLPVEKVTINDLKNQVLKKIDAEKGKEWGKTDDILLFWVGPGYKRPTTFINAQKEQLPENLTLKALYKDRHYRPSRNIDTATEDELYLYAIRI